MATSAQLVSRPAYRAMPNSTPITGVDIPPFTVPFEKVGAYLHMPPQDLVYSPPPSPTKINSIPRFESPGFLDGTPSLLDESLPSTISSPSLAHTPMPYATTRVPRQDSASFVGLGISGVFSNDGSVFDGMGVLPKRDESDELGFFMDESSQRSADEYSYAQASYPEQQEDAWRRRMSATTELFSQFGINTAAGLWSPRTQPLGCSSPADRAQTMVASPTLPAEPETDDVFYTRSPTFDSPLMRQDVLEWLQAAPALK
ncbi:hypothetical protein PsYK624_105190 [Phanerochaete sordida]|uniref:Uncharacterized protein n=1 Tax=Phanerochaete sordida TaxID=48140 RepID=A0A9P3GIP6_9APHY|nr:hypothetical protein PsYK624_105190 [Phanerochaete sordida]